MTLRDAAILIGGLGVGLVVGSIANGLFGEPAAVAIVVLVVLLAVVLLTRRRRR